MKFKKKSYEYSGFSVELNQLLSQINEKYEYSKRIGQGYLAGKRKDKKKTKICFLIEPGRRAGADAPSLADVPPGSVQYKMKEMETI